MFSSSADYYTIRLGEYHRIRVEGNEQDIKGKQIITHPGYNSPSPFNKNRFIASSPQCFVSDVLSELVDGDLYM